MRLCTVTGDQQYIKASAKYFVVSLAGGGGPMCAGRLDRPGRFQSDLSPCIEGHAGAVLDVDFNPFDDSMFASASEDTTIKLWSIPDDWEPTDAEGLAKPGKNLSESLTDLTGHSKKVTLLRYHPTASNILLSTSADYTTKVWDIEKGEAVHTFTAMSDYAMDIVWDTRGDVYATSCKDKAVRFVDGRSGDLAQTIALAHEGTKSVKLAYMGETGKLLSVGATKQSAREMKIWDIRNLNQSLTSEKVDTASGAMIPLYDNDTNVIYLCGKGDGIVRLYEFEDKAPYLHKLNDGFRSTVPAKGACMVPKRGLDVMKCETARILKVTSSQGIHPLSFQVPRKSDAFQDDIFPDCASAIPAHSGEKWLLGSSRAPLTMSLNPDFQKSNGDQTKKKVFKSVSQLSKELDEADKRVRYLEKILKSHGIPYD
jgi:coronin-1B/1C/6